jgi:bifunctional non-homologous end joining protein LigD
VRERLDPFIARRSPLTEPVKKPKATWVEPQVLAEIEYSGVTDDGLLRAPVFKGLRDDLADPAPRAAAKKTPAVSKANILQLLPDAVAPGKPALQAYWRKVAKRALEHLGRRPLKLVRNVHGTIFYHRGAFPPIPDAVHQLKIEKREGGEGTRLWVDDLAGLLGLVEIGAVELHPWNATVDDIELADRIVIDLDPGEGIEWDFVTETALALRDLLRAEGIKSWPKVTGSKGIHVMGPLEAPMPHDAARNYARKLAQKLAEQRPEKYLLSSQPQARSGRIFLDYLRNGRGNTAAGAWSPRVRPGFPIAAPVTWKQVEQGIRPDAFTMEAPFRRKRGS